MEQKNQEFKAIVHVEYRQELLCTDVERDLNDFYAEHPDISSWGVEVEPAIEPALTDLSDFQAGIEPANEKVTIELDEETVRMLDELVEDANADPLLNVFRETGLPDINRNAVLKAAIAGVHEGMKRRRSLDRLRKDVLNGLGVPEILFGKENR